ncbi:MAG TPA: hypothetical protein VIV37_04180 [Gaiellaceae bacterium]
MIEILFDIKHGLKDLDVDGSRQRLLYGAFIAGNPQFLELTAQRVESYWNCYYRHSYRRDEYPGFALLSSLRRAAAVAALIRWLEGSPGDHDSRELGIPDTSDPLI